MYYVYILKSKKDNNLYIGSTSDLRKRLTEHNTGKVKSTKPRLPFSIVYYEAYIFEEEARTRESRLKPRSRAWIQLRSRIAKSLG